VSALPDVLTIIALAYLVTEFPWTCLVVALLLLRRR
jgi:hypothetical protein